MNNRLLLQKLKYLLITSAVSGVQFLLLPLYANLLGVEEFGWYSYFYAVLAWATFIATLGAPTKIRRLLANRVHFSIVHIAHVLDLVVIFGLVATLSLVCLGLHQELSFLSITALLVYFVSYIFSQLVVSAQLGMGAMIASALQNAAFVLVPLSLTIILELNRWEERFLLSFIVCIPIFYLCRRFLSKNKWFSCSVAGYAKQLMESLQIAANSFYDKLLSQGDKIAVGALFGMETLGIYALGAQISNVLHMAMKSFVVFAEKGIFSRDKQAVFGVMCVSVFGLCLGGAVYFLVAYLFDYLFDASFSSVLDILFLQILVVWARVVQGLVFSLSYMSEAGWRYSIIQYVCMLMFVIVGWVCGSDLWFFCLFLLCSILVGLSVNLLLSAVKFTWR